jgi:hypothetical protein
VTVSTRLAHDELRFTASRYPPEHPDDWSANDFVPTEELARRQGVKPIESVDELAQPDLWESDEEYEAFLADLYASRRAGVA